MGDELPDAGTRIRFKKPHPWHGHTGIIIGYETIPNFDTGKVEQWARVLLDDPRDREPKGHEAGLRDKDTWDFEE